MLQVNSVKIEPGVHEISAEKMMGLEMVSFNERAGFVLQYRHYLPEKLGQETLELASNITDLYHNAKTGGTENPETINAMFKTMIELNSKINIEIHANLANWQQELDELLTP